MLQFNRLRGKKKSQLQLLTVSPVTPHNKITSPYVPEDDAYTKFYKHRET